MTDLQDDIEIRNLLARVAMLADTDTVDRYVEAFTEDAVFEIPGRPSTHGRQELRERTSEQRAAGVVGPSSSYLHVLGSSVIDVDGDAAVAHTPWLVSSATSDPTISLAGRYRDQLVRTAAGWKVHRRTLLFE